MKRKTKNIIVTVVIIALCLGAVGVIAGVFSKNKADEEGYVRTDLSYEIGALSATGKYEESDASIYTKTATKCDSVKVAVEFDANVEYQLFFYDDNDAFVSASSVLTNGSTTDLPEGATCFRMVIMPVWDTDVAEDDRTINFFNKGHYADQLTVSILENEETDEETEA